MDVFNECKSVLEKNWKGSFTIPSPRLYPFQWNWDSGFIALGNLHIHPERALIELETLFNGQWGNGFLPHILFHDEEKHSSYFPSADYWNSKICDSAPRKLKTSGITQPPVHGFVLESLYNYGFELERISILYDKVIEYHKYLYNFRQYKNSGLVAIWHNWESGMDNLIWWDEILNRIDESKVSHIELFRKDVQEVKEGDNTRPKDLDYKRYLYLVNTLRENGYHYVPTDFPFQIIDPVFNSILIESTRSLIKIGRELDKDISFIQSKLDESINSFSQLLWNEDDNLFYPYDIVENKQITKHCSGCYIPIFAGIPPRNMINLFTKKWQNSNLLPVPSAFLDQKGFEKKNFWRGPIWVNMNWMIWKGLLKYDFLEEAKDLKIKTIELIEKCGSYEYFDPFVNSENKIGYGGADFSWTASLIIDMIKSENI